MTPNGTAAVEAPPSAPTRSKLDDLDLAPGEYPS